MPKRTRTRRPTSPAIVASLDPNGPRIRRPRLDRFIAHPEDIEFITVVEVKVAKHPSSKDGDTEAPATPEPPAETTEK